MVLDCRLHPDANCSLMISGTEQEVLDAGELHAISKHGFKKEAGLRENLRSFLKEEALAH